MNGQNTSATRCCSAGSGPSLAMAACTPSWKGDWERERDVEVLPSADDGAGGVPRWLPAAASQVSAEPRRPAPIPITDASLPPPSPVHGLFWANPLLHLHHRWRRDPLRLAADSAAYRPPPSAMDLGKLSSVHICRISMDKGRSAPFISAASLLPWTIVDAPHPSPPHPAWHWLW
jgi:hypothetical protein